MIKRALIIVLIIGVFELVASKVISSALGVEFSVIQDVLVPLYEVGRDFIRWVVS